MLRWEEAVRKGKREKRWGGQSGGEHEGIERGKQVEREKREG